MGFSVWQILIVLALILLLFGTRKLRSAGSDLGEAVQGFRHAIREENESDSECAAHSTPSDGTAVGKERGRS